MKTQLKKDDLINFTTEDLIHKKKSTSFVIGLLVGALLGLSIIVAFQIVNGKFTSLLIVAFSTIPVLFMLCNQVNKINKELKTRK